MRFRSCALSVALIAATVAGTHADAVAQEHGRKYKPPPPTAHVVVTVVKAFNGKPFVNAGVVFHAILGGRDDGTLEVKTDPEGHATIDVLEVGSHVLVQVIASGYATSASEFDLAAGGKQLTVRLRRPEAQVSVYQDNDGKPAQVQPGVQERQIPKTTQPDPQ